MVIVKKPLNESNLKEGGAMKVTFNDFYNQMTNLDRVDFVTVANEVQTSFKVFMPGPFEVKTASNCILFDHIRSGSVTFGAGDVVGGIDLKEDNNKTTFLVHLKTKITIMITAMRK